MFIEEVKYIKDYNNKYCISNTGKVYMTDYRGQKCWREMKLRLIKGYPSVGLRKVINGKSVQTIYKIHRLVAEYFIDNPENKPVVNHKDGIKTNNHYSNLEWVTIAENTQHSYANKLQYNFWSLELAKEAIVLIEKYHYNFADVAKLFNLPSRSNVYHFYTKGYKTFGITTNNIKVKKVSKPKLLEPEYLIYLQQLLKDNTVLNNQIKK